MSTTTDETSPGQGSPGQGSRARRGRLAWGSAVLGPVLVAAVLIPVRTLIDDVNVALVLVVVVVGVAAQGRRLAGVVAAVVAGLAFDFFWTAPRFALTIRDPREVETAVLLVVVGAVVSELAWLGLRAQRRSARSRGYLEGATRVVAAFDAGASAEVQIDLVETQVAEVLGVDRCRFRRSTTSAPGSRRDVARLDPDGTLRRAGMIIDVGRRGLPSDTMIEIPVRAAGTVVGELEVVAAAAWSRPTSEQLQVAALLAAQLGSVLASDYASGPPPTR